MTRRGAAVLRTAAGAVLMLLLLSGAAMAQETVPPTPTPTPTVEPAPESGAEAETEAGSDGERLPEIIPVEEPAPIVETDPAEEAEAEKEIPEELEEPFDLHAYPASAKQTPGDKWRTFKDGVRGLLVWDFFDSRLTIRAHARIQVDGTLARADDKMVENLGKLGNSIDLRRFQVFAQGTIDHHLRYSLSFNFGADAGFGDVFVEGREHGLNVFGYRVGQFRLGSFQEPFSFERVMSSYYTGFLERSLPAWTFTPGNNLGYMVFDTTKNKRLSWAVGFFSWGQADESNASNSVLSVTSRVTWLPVYRDGGRTLLHVGGSFSTRDPNGDTRYRSRPEARFVDFLVDTGDIPASRIKLYGLELVGVRGPLSFQSELIVSDITASDAGDPRFWGGYVQVSWFLTGEQKSYDTEMGVFSRVIPKEDSRGLFKKRPGGGLELTGRISNVDLDDGPITGGKMLDYSFGVNWYMTSTTAVKLNYIHSVVEDNGRANIVLLRFQFRPLPVPGWR